MKVLVCGTRGCVSNDVRWNLGNELFQLSPSLIIHGACGNSADTLADQYAHEHGIEVERHPAQWDVMGRGAGMIRNHEMALREPDICIAVWDGKSKGTLNMIQRCVEYLIPVTIIPAKVST